MPRVTFVARAQQRYATKPVIDPDTGLQKQTLMLDRRTGEPKRTKHGREVYLKLTERDLDQPLPMPQCDYPGCKHETREIKVGTPYKHISPKSGPYGGRTLTRHGDCPTWNPWDYSSSLSARVAQVQSEGADMIAGSTLESEDDFESLRDDLVASAEELRDEKQESLDNMPEGLGEQLEEIVSSLDSWVDAIGDAECPDFPEVEERWFIVDTHNSRERAGDDEGYETEDEADSALEDIRVDAEAGDEEWDEARYEIVGETPEGPTEEALEEWREAAAQVLQDALDDFQG